MTDKAPQLADLVAVDFPSTLTSGRRIRFGEVSRVTATGQLTVTLRDGSRVRFAPSRSGFREFNSDRDSATLRLDLDAAGRVAVELNRASRLSSLLLRLGGLARGYRAEGKDRAEYLATVRLLLSSAVSTIDLLEQALAAENPTTDTAEEA